MEGASPADRAWLSNFVFELLRAPRVVLDDYFTVMVGPKDRFSIAGLAGDSAEFAFDARGMAYLTFIDRVLELMGFEDLQLAGWLSLRFTGKTRALLGMQRFDPTAHVEIGTVRTRVNARAFRRINLIARSLGGVPHWGQLHDMDEAAVQTIYGEDLKKWRKALRSVSRYGSRTTFSNAFTRSRGLEPKKMRIDDFLLFRSAL